METTEHDPTSAEVHANGTRPVAAVTAAHRFLGWLFDEQPVAKEQFEKARHARSDWRSAEATVAEATPVAKVDAERLAALRRELDPAGTRRVRRWLAFGGAAVLGALDIVPAWMAAQSFGLDANDTDAVAVLIVIALAGAMVLLDTRVGRSHRGLVQAGVGAGLGLLFILRVVFLQVTGSASLPAAILASAALTAVSGLLVLFGAVLLGHRVPKEIAAAEQKAAASRQALEAAEDALRAAAGVARTTRTALGHTVSTAALAHQPEGTDPEAFSAAVAEVLRTQLDAYAD